MTYMISKENAEHYLWANSCDGWHLVKQAYLSVIHEKMPPATAEVRHFHQKSQQFFFVLSGVATLEIAGKRELLYPHQGVEVPAGMPDQMFNAEQDLEFLVISQPPSHGDRILAK